MQNFNFFLGFLWRPEQLALLQLLTFCTIPRSIVYKTSLRTIHSSCGIIKEEL